jgi:putative SOS response-associated peptidase YedK
MPLIIEEQDWPAWLGEVAADPATVLHPSLAGPPSMSGQSRAVNSPQSNGAELLAKLHARAGEAGWRRGS